MDLTFGKDDILSYSRGLITLGATMPSKSDPVDLINLEELRHELAKSKSIDLTEVEKIVIGYNITYNKGINTVEFEPNWFIL
ncbi:two-component system activity regulator YycH, partial [Enterobacter asburiae]|uniref:two-component system activity regulator YycH n=1 Tax=Enterobacter asburiae TaxID=61645 RepID=UPI0032AE9964